MGDIYFELFDAGDLIRIEPLGLIKYDSDFDWDENWIKSRVTVKGGTFSGQYSADFMTISFEKFKRELSLLCDNLNGVAVFSDIEGYLGLKIKGDGIGHFEVYVTASDQPGIGGILTYTMGFDQTELSSLIDQLNLITKAFPIIGEIGI